jgi:hypothetical protein
MGPMGEGQGRGSMEESWDGGEGVEASPIDGYDVMRRCKGRGRP